MISLISKNAVSAATLIRKMSSSSSKDLVFKTLAVEQVKPFVFHVQLNRPDKLNALNTVMWYEIHECFNKLNDNEDCRSIVLSANGKHFTAGIDLVDGAKLGQQLTEYDDLSRRGRFLERKIKSYQDAFSSLEVCVKPVIAVVHNACIGAGIDLITAADIRYASKDAFFQVKEVDIGMAADVGTLQRLPKVIGSQSLVRELCFTGRKFLIQEAFDCGLISKVLDTKEQAVEEAIKIAELIAEKSPVAVQTTKQNMVYSLDHTNQEGLDHIRNFNQMQLQSEDFINATMAQLTKGEKPVFSKL